MNRTQQRKRRNTPPLRLCKWCRTPEKRDQFGLGFSNFMLGYCAECINRAQHALIREGGR